MGPRGHGKCALGGGGVRAGSMHRTCVYEVWVVGGMWDHGAMSHGCQGVEGMGAMRRARAERAGMHRGPFEVI